MNASENRTERINAQIIGFPAPDQVRLLIAPGSGVLDGGVPVDIPLEIVPVDLRADGQFVVAVFNPETHAILAVEPDSFKDPHRKCDRCHGLGLRRDSASGLLTDDKCDKCGGRGSLPNETG